MHRAVIVVLTSSLFKEACMIHERLRLLTNLVCETFLILTLERAPHLLLVLTCHVTRPRLRQLHISLRFGTGCRCLRWRRGLFQNVLVLASLHGLLEEILIETRLRRPPFAHKRCLRRVKSLVAASFTVLTACCRAMVNLPGLVVATILGSALNAQRIRKGAAIFFVDTASAWPSDATHL